MMKDYQHATRSMVICSIANCYYTLLMLDRQLEILNDMEALTAETYRMMKLQKELRSTKETAVVSAQAANLSVKTDIIDMKRQIREMENTLSTLVGMHAQSISRGKLADQNLPEEFSTGIALNVLSARPDVHAAEMKLANCFYDVKKAQSAFYPSLKITGTGSFTNSMGNAVSNPGFFLANFVAGLTQPIFMNGRLIAQLKVAKLSYEVAEKEWRQIILEAGAEVSNCLVEYNSSKEMEELERRQVEALAKSVDYTLMLYKMGTSSYLEVISAQSSLLNAEISQVVDEFNKMQAVVNLYSALGGGRE
jgi:outer membrane protein TolC